MPNIEKLDATLAFTREHLATWEQGVWAKPIFDAAFDICGTACCFAGNALLVEGYRFEWYLTDDNTTDIRITAPGGEVVSDDESFIMGKAKVILSLTPAEGIRLFNGANDLDQLAEIIDGWR